MMPRYQSQGPTPPPALAKVPFRHGIRQCTPNLLQQRNRIGLKLPQLAAAICSSAASITGSEFLGRFANEKTNTFGVLLGIWVPGFYGPI
jgi:hypothetical protein